MGVKRYPGEAILPESGGRSDADVTGGSSRAATLRYALLGEPGKISSSFTKFGARSFFVL